MSRSMSYVVPALEWVLDVLGAVDLSDHLVVIPGGIGPAAAAASIAPRDLAAGLGEPEGADYEAGEVDF